MSAKTFQRQDRKLGTLTTKHGSHLFLKYDGANIPTSAVDWLREHRVSLLLFDTSGYVPPKDFWPESQPYTPIVPSSVPPEPAPSMPNRTEPAAPSAVPAASLVVPELVAAQTVPRPLEPALPHAATHPDSAAPAEWLPLLVTRLPLPLLEHKALLSLLSGRPEWADSRVTIKYRPRVKGQSFYEVECVETLDCAKKWRAFYITIGNNMHPPGTLILQTLGDHSHQQQKATGKLFTPRQLSVAEKFVLGNGRDLRGLERAFAEARIPTASLPSRTQLSNWLKRQKQNKKLTLARHTHLVEVGKLEIAGIPRSLPDDLTTLFLLEAPVVTKDEVCILFSCRGMIQQLQRYQDSALCFSVDAKMKVAKHGYGVATFGLLTKDGLRKTTLTRSSATKTKPAERTQGFAYASHTLPIAQALIHQETDVNFRRLFQTVDVLWQKSASPPRPSLAKLSFQLHKDFKKEIESARLACFPQSRACDDFFHWSQKQHTTMAAKCCKMVLKKGKWVKENLGWTVAAVHVLRLLPTLPLFSHVWRGFLKRLESAEETDLVAWLKTYERPIPHDLQAKYRDTSSSLIYCSFWTGREGLVPGSGAGSQPAEALHSPWQRHLESLGGAGDIGHVMSVMQKLYNDYWQKWFDWSSPDPLTFSPQVGL